MKRGKRTMYEDAQEALRAIYNALNSVYQLCKTEPLLKYPLIVIICGQIILFPFRMINKALELEERKPRRKKEKSWRYEENV